MSNVRTSTQLLRNIRGLHDKTWSTSAIPLATYASLQSTTWSLGLLNQLEHPQLRSQIRDLAFRTDYQNPFFELPMLEPSIEHLNKGEMHYLYLSEKTGSHETIKLFAPVRIEKTALLRRPVIRIWSHIYAPLGHPLIDKRNIDETMNAFINCLINPNSDQPAVLLFDDMPRDSALSQALYESPLLAESLHRFSLFERAALNAVPGKTYNEAHVSGKRRQRLRKATERLETRGKVQLERSTTKQDVMKALEHLLDLEKASWKGKRGSALKNTKTLAHAARQNVSAMAEANKCDVFSLSVDGKCVAATVVYKTSGWCFPWKTAFDETYYEYSVGNILTNQMNQILSTDSNFQRLDSLAAQHNETANRFWPDTIKLCSMAIGVGNQSDVLAKKIMDELVAQRKAKAYAKKLLRR